MMTHFGEGADRHSRRLIGEMHSSSKQLLRDGKVENLMLDLYFRGQVGWAAAEYNLEKAGLIEMIQGHRAGQMSTTAATIAGAIVDGQ
jgi:hypothetical protein